VDLIEFYYHCRKLDLGQQPLTIGGINDINVPLRHPGQIESHDFVGCMREFKINNEDYLHSNIFHCSVERSHKTGLTVY
jgi:hypothetical protein